MNDPQAPKLPENESAELEQFEQQLKAFAPRPANVRLPDQVQATSATISEAGLPRPARRVPSTLLLLATWSTGVAAGVLVTLALQPPQSNGAAPVAIQHNAESPPVEPPVARVPPSPPLKAVPDPKERTKLEDRASPNPFAIAGLQWPVRELPTADGKPLTAFSRTIVMSELDGRFEAAGTPSDGQSHSADRVERQTTIVPIKVNLPPPTNQRDMLMDLIDSYGSIY